VRVREGLPVIAIKRGLPTGSPDKRVVGLELDGLDE
jgi:hypothetical protein